MNPPVAARAQASQSSLHDRLKDPSLLRDRCYIDGAFVGRAAWTVEGFIATFEAGLAGRNEGDEVIGS